MVERVDALVAEEMHRRGVLAEENKITERGRDRPP